MFNTNNKNIESSVDKKNIRKFISPIIRIQNLQLISAENLLGMVKTFKYMDNRPWMTYNKTTKIIKYVSMNYTKPK